MMMVDRWKQSWRCGVKRRLCPEGPYLLSEIFCVLRGVGEESPVQNSLLR